MICTPPPTKTVRERNAQPGAYSEMISAFPKSWSEVGALLVLSWAVPSSSPRHTMSQPRPFGATNHVHIGSFWMQTLTSHTPQQEAPPRCSGRWTPSLPASRAPSPPGSRPFLSHRALSHCVSVTPTPRALARSRALLGGRGGGKQALSSRDVKNMVLNQGWGRRRAGGLQAWNARPDGALRGREMTWVEGRGTGALESAIPGGGPDRAASWSGQAGVPYLGKGRALPVLAVVRGPRREGAGRRGRQRVGLLHVPISTPDIISGFRITDFQSRGQAHCS